MTPIPVMTTLRRIKTPLTSSVSVLIGQHETNTGRLPPAVGLTLPLLHNDRVHCPRSVYDTLTA